MNQQHKNTFVIGLTGPIASGKGAVAGYVARWCKEHGLTVETLLLSDILRERLREKGVALTRDTLREEGNALRRERGRGALVDLATMRRAEESDVLVIDSIRNPGEIERIREIFGERFVQIVATRGDLETRIASVIERNRVEDGQDPETIARDMKIEMERNPEFGFDIEGCAEMADMINERQETHERGYEVMAEYLRGRFYPSNEAHGELMAAK